MDVLHLAPLTGLQQLTTGVERQPVFCTLLGDMQFEQHLDDAPATLRLTINLFQELQRVNSLDHRHIRRNVLHLVRL